MSSLLNRFSKVFVSKKQDSRNNGGTENSEKLNGDQNLRNNSFENDYLSIAKRFKISKKRLKRDDRILGAGMFGFIRSGTLQIDGSKENKIKVAIKSVRNSSNLNCIRGINGEIKVLSSLEPHPNILTFIGFVISRSPEIVTELVESGNLRPFLRTRRHIFHDQLLYSNSNPREKTEEFENTEMSTDQNNLCTFDLVSYAYQIANGMEYLASVPCNHRNLELCNIFISHDNTIRIGSFAFSGRHGNNENYICQITEDQLIPKWITPPEVHKNMNTSEKTDVYGFAALLNELFNLGESCFDHPLDPFFPFPRPGFCPPQIYELMLKCCNSDPALRPTFT